MGSYNSNQFGISREIGTLDLTIGGTSTAFTVRLSKNSTATDGVVAGQAVKLVDLGDEDSSGPPIVEVATADEVAFGARLFTPKNGKTMPGRKMQVSSFGCVQVMEAGGPLDRGADVRFVPANPGRIAAQGTKPKFGTLLDKAKAEGDLVRVHVLPEKV